MRKLIAFLKSVTFLQNLEFSFVKLYTEYLRIVPGVQNFIKRKNFGFHWETYASIQAILDLSESSKRFCSMPKIEEKNGLSGV